MTAFDLLAVSALITTPLSIGLGAAWWSARMENRHLREMTDRLLERGERDRAASDARQLSATVEGIALEVERLAESQRFVARMLAERPEGGQARSSTPPRVITPH